MEENKDLQLHDALSALFYRCIARPKKKHFGFKKTILKLKIRFDFVKRYFDFEKKNWTCKGIDLDLLDQR